MNETQYADAHRTEIEALIAEAMPDLIIEAAHVLARRRNTFLSLDLSRIIDEPEPANWFKQRRAVLMEHKFRKGFLAGYSRAMDDLKPASDEAAWQTAATFYDGALSRWTRSYAENPSGYEQPPALVEGLAEQTVRNAQSGAYAPPDPEEGTYNEQIGCNLKSVAYDPLTQTGTLYLPAGDCTDMRGAIAFFLDIHPEVKTIRTISGENPDTSYLLVGGRWRSQRPPRY